LLKNEIPEMVDISTPYKQRKRFWYECKFFPRLEKIIQEPEYIGDRSSYHIYHYQRMTGSAYDYGLCYYMMDMQDINVIITTILVLQSMRYQKIEKQIVDGSLVNQDEYEEFGYRLGVNAKIDQTWQKNNPGQEAVRHMPLPQFPEGILVLNGMLEKSMKNISGVTDSLQGSPMYNNQSGIATAQFMAQGQIYHKEEKLKGQDFIQDIGYGLMFDICENRDIPHYINYLSAENEQMMVLVNDPMNSPFFFEPERMTLSVAIIEDIELHKQLFRELVMSLYDRGIISSRRVLEEMPFPNPSKLYDEAMEEKGMLEIMNLLSANPELKQELQQMAMQFEQGGGQAGGSRQASGYSEQEATLRGVPKSKYAGGTE
jgi:hypothetical protein